MKFSGIIGFWEGDVEVKKGVYKSKIVERKYVGDVQNYYKRFQGSEYQNDDFIISNRISILADIYAQENFMSIKYIVWKGKALKVKTVEIKYPRIILDIGGVYNGERPTSIT